MSKWIFDLRNLEWEHSFMAGVQSFYFLLPRVNIETKTEVGKMKQPEIKERHFLAHSTSYVKWLHGSLEWRREIECYFSEAEQVCDEIAKLALKIVFPKNFLKVIRKYRRKGVSISQFFSISFRSVMFNGSLVIDLVF